ncbi:MAG: cupredoxin domain-containing protein [Pseudonocardiaceae bacterium]
MTPISRTRSHRTRCLLAALAVALSATATLTLAPSAAGGQGHDAQSVTVPIQNFTFTPPDLTINTGDTVTWVNQDRAPHDVTATSGPGQFASGTLAQGKSFSHTFSAPGAYDYQCTIHPNMVATVTALDHDPAPAAPPPAEEAPAPEEGVPADDAPAESAPEEGAPEEGAQGAVEPTVAADASAATAAPTPTALPLPAAAPPAPATTQAVGATQGRQLDPLLIIAGVALGVATLCLLLVTSRSTGRG